VRAIVLQHATPLDADMRNLGWRTVLEAMPLASDV